MTIQANTSSTAAPAPSLVSVASELIAADPSSSNIFCLIAEMLGDNDKLNKASKPTDQKETIAYIEQALSQAINSKDFDSNMEFWVSLSNSLPKDSPLLPYVTGQLNLFIANPNLQKLEDQYGGDLKKLQDALAEMQGYEDKEKGIQDKIDQVQKQINDTKNDLDHAEWYQFIRIGEDVGTLAGLGIELGGLYIALEAGKAVIAAAKLHNNPDGAQATVDGDTASIAQEKNLTNAKSKNFNLQSGNEASSVLNAVKQANNTTLTELTQETGIAKILGAISASKA